MKKVGGQISIAIVCCILGFMIAYQLKMINMQESKISIGTDPAEINAQLDKLKNQKTDYQKKVDELENQVKQYQNSAASISETNKQMVNELEETRMLTGNVDVHGEGIIITLTPQNLVFSNNIDNTQPIIKDTDIVDLVNEINIAGAEAVAINDLRIDARTGIKVSSGGDDILIGDDGKISPFERITIKVIGDKKTLSLRMAFPGAYGNIPQTYKKETEPQDNITMSKTNKVYKYNYAKPVIKK